MLSNLEIEHVLVEAHAETARYPKAHLINQRSTEILDQHKLLEPILEIGCPHKHMKYFTYMTGLGGSGVTDAKVLGKVGCYGFNDDPGLDADHLLYKRASAYMGTNLPLVRLEPLLRREAERRNPDRILFSHLVTSIREENDSVVAKVLNRETKEEIVYRADYVIAADGGKTIGPALGIKTVGQLRLADTTSVYFKADVSKYYPDDAMLVWNLGLQGQENELGDHSPLFGADWTTLVMNGPTWGKHSEEWVLHIGMGQIHVPLETLTEDALKMVMRRCLKIPDLDIEILHTSRWHMDGIYASQYQTKRVFLAGDAAHRQPPISGLGLNTAIGDAHNITWKLATVVKGLAPPSLLRTYGMERLPVAKRVVAWGLFAFMQIRVMDSASGLVPGGKAVLERNTETLEKLCADSWEGSVRRAAFAHALENQRIETCAHDLEIGSVYPEGDMVHDGTTAPEPDPRGRYYVPMARPGHRMPHAWLVGAKGSPRISTHHLLDSTGGWALITDDSRDGDRWIQEAAKLEKKHGIKVNAVRVGPKGDFADENGQWAADSGLEPSGGGAVLTRPDGYVAMRAFDFSETALSNLALLISSRIYEEE
jgi:2,4-dichlorophenol 6-monooxygenase